LCGAVAFSLDPAAVAATVACRCDNCRKVSGGAAGIYLQVKRTGFQWKARQDRVARFESSPGNYRGLCEQCGCPAPIETSYGAVRVPAGLLDQDPGSRPDVVLFAEREAPWCDISAVKESFVDTGPERYWRSMVARLHGFG
jgi:hypothetical protein